MVDQSHSQSIFQLLVKSLYHTVCLVVVCCCQPVINQVEQSWLQMADANCTPLSDVTVEGTPKRLTPPVKKAVAHSSVELPRMGTASAHFVLLSTIVKGWEKPPLTIGRGPTRLMCTCENRLTSNSIVCTCVCTRDLTLLLAHC
jgi:hypothetical protein